MIGINSESFKSITNKHKYASDDMESYLLSIRDNMRIIDSSITGKSLEYINQGIDTSIRNIESINDINKAYYNVLNNVLLGYQKEDEEVKNSIRL